jgi:hypothetical protein
VSSFDHVTVSPTPTEISDGSQHSLVSSHPGTEVPAGTLTSAANADGIVAANPATITRSPKKVDVFIFIDFDISRDPFNSFSYNFLLEIETWHFHRLKNYV